jgi:hypothetical protein
MYPSDTTPTSGLNHQADKAYNTDGSCQGSPPGAPESLPDKRKVRRNTGADLTRLYVLYLSNPTQARLDELMTNCMKLLERRVAYYVLREKYCPDSVAAETFIDDALSRAHYKFSKGIHALRSSEVLWSWIDRVARSAVVEELYDVVRRTKIPCSFEPLEVCQPDGSVTQVLDRAETLDAVARYGSITLGRVQFEKELVYRDILGKLFRAAGTSSRRQREGIALLKSMLSDDLTVDDVVTQSGMEKAQVESLLRTARNKLRTIAETTYKFTAEDL